MQHKVIAATCDIIAAMSWSDAQPIHTIKVEPRAGVYVVYSEGEAVYCGISNDLRRRISYLRKDTASHHDKASDVQEALAAGQDVTIKVWYETGGIPRQLIEQAVIHNFNLRHKWNAA